MDNTLLSRIHLFLLTIFLCVIYPEKTLASLLAFQGQYQSELEENAAISNQAVYDQLKAGGCKDDEEQISGCTGTTFLVWNNVRELVHTANELTNNGPTLHSLDTDLEGLGFALRWTAGEEFSSEESLMDSFVSGQLSGLASRITALRGGARGFNIAGIATDRNGDIARLSNRKLTGLNSGDEMSEAWSRLGGFINGTYTYGNQKATDREDAFDFDGTGLNAGLDYRLDDHWVVGALFGYITEKVDFDAGKSIVDGGVEMDGLSLISFLLYQSDSWFYSASAGYQVSDFTTERSIRYPSFNPNVESTNTVAKSSNDADTVSYSMSGGMAFFLTEQFVVEPSLTLNYQDVSIDEYREQDINNAGFDFVVDKQRIESFESVMALKTQYTVSTKYGVFVPFADYQFYTQHNDSGHSIRAAYLGSAETLTNDAYFVLPTNNVDAYYNVYGLGVSAVLRGAQQSGSGDAASGGIQMYLSYREVIGIRNYRQKSFSYGLRYEF